MTMNKFFSKFRYTLLVAVVFSLFVIGGCGDDDEPNGPTEYETIMDLVESPEFQQAEGADVTVALDSLAKLLNQYPDLEALLTGATEYTLFAPSNQAFINLLATPGFPSDIRDISPDLIEGVLAYHIVAGANLSDVVCAWGATGEETLYTHPGACGAAGTVQVIKANGDCTLLTGSTNDEIDILEADRENGNGVVHIVESVMIPPAIGASLTPILGKLSATILLGADFTYLAKAMTIADCGTAGTDIAAILSGAGPYTTFLPPNPVFEGTAAVFPGGPYTVDQFIALFTAAQWREIILNMIVSGASNENADLIDALEMTTMQNANAKLTIDVVTPGAPPAGSPVGKMVNTSGGATGMGGTTNCPIYVVDIAASNGVAHAVGKILFPN